MMIHIVVIIGAALTAVNAEYSDNRVKHLVVLMMENHSFDNMLGWLKQQTPAIDGLTGNECNQVDPSDAASATFCVTDAGATVDPDPDHSLGGTAFEVYGTPSVAAADEHDPAKVTMGGFIATEAQRKGDAEWAPHIMDCMAPEHVPVISALASEFALFDAVFAGMPGPTYPNRLFGLSATSYGFSTNDAEQTVRGWPQAPLFKLVEDAGLDWRVYFKDAATPWLFTYMRTRERLGKSKPFGQFAADAAAGDLPAFTWLDPAYFPLPGQPASDQHPSHDVADGEAVIKVMPLGWGYGG